jgi:hypothetical protein
LRGVAPNPDGHNLTPAMKRARALVTAHAVETATGDPTVLLNEFAALDDEFSALSDDDAMALAKDLVVTLSRLGFLIAAFAPEIVNGVAADFPHLKLPAELIERLGSTQAVLDGTFTAIARWEEEQGFDPPPS